MRYFYKSVCSFVFNNTTIKNETYNDKISRFLHCVTKTISNYKSFEDNKRKIENHGFQQCQFTLKYKSRYFS